MKIPSTIAALSAFAFCCHAGEPNPFVKRDSEKSPAPPSGDSFVSLVEHILVPADQLDAWLDKNPLAGDASALRRQAQAWVAEKTARLDHTALSTGIAGREFSNESNLERIYATEYEPADPGEWSPPTAFDTRNLGYVSGGSAGIEDGAMVLRAQTGWVEMLLPHHAWNPLAEQTRQPDDVFIPRFRSIQVSRQREDAAGNRAEPDPFIEPKERAEFPPGSDQLRFDPGKTYLVSREDNESQEPKVSPHPDTTVKPSPKDPHHLVRLIFFRGNILPPAESTKDESLEINHLSLKLVRVPHLAFSNWVQENDLLETQEHAWSAVADWEKNGSAETTVSLTTANHAGSKCVLDSHVEVIYPTEYMPGKLVPATDGKPAQREYSLACAFDTRNCGTEFSAVISPDPKGAICKFEVSQVTDCGRSVHHRIFRDGEWKTDMTMPIFAVNRWNSEARVKRGAWLLVGSGTGVDDRRKPDPEHVILAFIKLD
ncbi:hypothetical protein JIN84_03815 [Luteolibacter yonseiensis]|uniref:Lysozyme inhibitor LprI N-terminal domain-containing protein n=1 Tax=Luteolibacter yonseiensis TaxID=1144680 RepID=A0A934R3B8_9BACT|nr:hypothetical protein [Luteolibacter yonseiensis]MBK1814725.1 hypothetical protein [Luteolibacter yonseiensis]